MLHPRPGTPAAALLLLLLAALPIRAQVQNSDPVDHTFSLVAVDPATGEVGATVTTRNACVGNGVPWVRVGVGAVATQAATRTAYGDEILDLLAAGRTAAAALDEALADDEAAAWRQLGVVAVSGGTAQHTGSEVGGWAGERAGPDFAAQGNVLVGPEVLAAVAASFEASRGSGRTLVDRMILAMEAGQAEGGDRRKGRLQSASVVIVDPRDGMARRADGQTVHINVCEHPTPVAELRRIHDRVSETLGHRTLERQSGSDIAQLRVLLHALGYWRPEVERLDPRSDGFDAYDDEIAAAVDAFRADQGLSTPEDGTPSGLVDEAVVGRIWAELEVLGRAAELRARLVDFTRIRR